MSVDVPETWLETPKRVSNSELSTWRRCRRKWYLAYFRALKRAHETATGPLAIGIRIHLALQGKYSTQGLDPRQILERTILEDMDRCPEHREDIEKEAELCRRMLTGYLEWLEETGEDEGLVVVGDEVKVEVGSGIRGVNFLGRLDVRMLRERDMARLFMDYKTVGDLTTPLKTLHLDTQMKMYHLIEFLMLRELEEDAEALRTDGALYQMLKKSKRTARATPPFYKRVPVQHNIHELRSYWIAVHGQLREMIEAWNRLNAGEDHRYVCFPTPDSTCAWQCDFFPVCPLFDDGSHAEGLLEASYVEYDPYGRYDDPVTGRDEGDE